MVSMERRTDDRTTRARIRDAAVACIAEHGFSNTTVRKVATAAGVSPGSVIHHFGSMEELRSACDAHVVALIRNVKQEAMTAGPGLDLLAQLRSARFGPVAKYLAEMLVEDSPAVDELVDDLVSDAESYLEQGVESGLLRPAEDAAGRAAVLAVWSLGALVLHRHILRLLGVDLTDPDIGTDPALGSYLGPAYEILGAGVFTPEAAAGLRTAALQVGGDPAARPIRFPSRPRPKEPDDQRDRDSH